MKALICAAIVCVLIGGCAADAPKRITPEERVRITKVSVQYPASGLTAKLGPLLPENAASGALEGAAGGFLGGLIYPPFWIVGGPILTTPVMASVMAACGAAVSESNNPEAKLRTMVEKVGLDGFARELSLRVNRRSAGTDQTAIADESPADTILDIAEIAVVLDGDSSGGGFACMPRLWVTSHWKAIHAADGGELEQRVSRSYAARSTKTFKEWFDDDAAIEQDIRSLLEKLARDVTYDLLIGP